jgi:hypothetical protein
VPRWGDAGRIGSTSSIASRGEPSPVHLALRLHSLPTMPRHPQTVSLRRSRRIATASRALALLASVSLFACEQTERDETARGDKPVSPVAGEPATTPPADRPSSMRPPIDEDRDDRDDREIAGRMGGPGGQEAARPYERPTTPAPTPGTTPGTGAMGESAQTAGTMIEKTAAVNMRTFERRFEDELGGEDLTLAAAFDVPGETKMRMFVVAPKDLDGGDAGTMPPPGGAMGRGSPPSQGGAMGGAGMPPSEGGAMGGGPTPPPSDAAGGTTPRPQPGMPGGEAGAADMPPSGSAMGGQASSKQAESALQKARLVIAYSDENRPEEVTIAYMKSSQPAMGGEQPDQKLHAAIDRIVGEAMEATPPKPDEERRG